MPRTAQIFELTAPKQAEHALQIDCRHMLDRVLQPGMFWSGIDHGHSMDRTIGRHGKPIGLIEGAKRKARGIKAGIPDFLFFHQARLFAIELKTVDGMLSDDQKERIRELLANGAEVSVCWTIWQVFDRVVAWGLCRPGVRVMT